MKLNSLEKKLEKYARKGSVVSGPNYRRRYCPENDPGHLAAIAVAFDATLLCACCKKEIKTTTRTVNFLASEQRLASYLCIRCTPNCTTKKSE